MPASVPGVFDETVFVAVEDGTTIPLLAEEDLVAPESNE